MNTIKREVFEILLEFEQQKTKAKRKEVLLKYADVPALKDVLRGTFDDSLQFTLPEGTPPYNPNRPESVPSTLLKKHRVRLLCQRWTGRWSAQVQSRKEIYPDARVHPSRGCAHSFVYGGKAVTSEVPNQETNTGDLSKPNPQLTPTIKKLKEY